MWDFDATLAERPGIWSQAMLDLLDQQVPGHAVTRADIKDGIRGQFPWNFSEEPHGYIDDPTGWWAHVNPMLARAFTGVGCSTELAAELASDVRQSFLRPAAWRLFDDTLDALQRATGFGWRNIIVSNHVPELMDLVVHLGLDPHVDIVISSALVGFDKPNPQIYSHALATAGHPDEVWMIGDNPVADVAGAMALGIPAIQVRTEEIGQHKVDGLHAALDLIL